MTGLPTCPVCCEGDLKLVPYDLDGQLHYRVECGSCGIEYEHHRFGSYNATTAFFEDAGRGYCPDCDAEVVK